MRRSAGGNGSSTQGVDVKRSTRSGERDPCLSAANLLTYHHLPANGYAGGMSTTLDFPMSASTGTDAFAPATGVFADIVFDRPLDHAYSYAVPPELVERIGVGKRVEAPFGRGDTG